jgi:pimeloyl-ACP methyl ester carboxylesterase
MNGIAAAGRSMLRDVNLRVRDLVNAVTISSRQMTDEASRPQVGGLAVQEESVSVRGQAVHLYRRPGVRDTAVWLIHGLGDWAATWRGLFMDPALQPWEVIAPDLPGYGMTEPLTSSPSSTEELSSWLAGTLQEVTPDRRVVLIGHSLGGVIATLIAERRPAWLAGVVNIEGNLTEADCFLSGAAAGAASPTDWYEGLLNKVRADGAKHEAMRSYGAGLALADRRTFFSCSRDLVRLCEHDGLGQRYQALKVPRLYCHGDTLSAPSLDLLERAGEARESFPGAGHWVQVDASELLSKSLFSWLTDNESTTSSS